MVELEFSIKLCRAKDNAVGCTDLISATTLEATMSQIVIAPVLCLTTASKICRLISSADARYTFAADVIFSVCALHGLVCSEAFISP